MDEERGMSNDCKRDNKGMKAKKPKQRREASEMLMQLTRQSRRARGETVKRSEGTNIKQKEKGRPDEIKCENASRTDRSLSLSAYKDLERRVLESDSAPGKS